MLSLLVATSAVPLHMSAEQMLIANASGHLDLSLAWVSNYRCPSGLAPTATQMNNYWGCARHCSPRYWANVYCGCACGVPKSPPPPNPLPPPPSTPPPSTPPPMCEVPCSGAEAETTLISETETNPHLERAKALGMSDKQMLIANSTGKLDLDLAWVSNYRCPAGRTPTATSMNNYWGCAKHCTPRYWANVYCGCACTVKKCYAECQPPPPSPSPPPPPPAAPPPVCLCR